MTLNLVIGIPTVGRADVVREILIGILRQSRRPDRIIVCGSKPADVVGLETLAGVEIMLSRPGLPRQRNALIAAAPEADAMLFLDDDFVMAADYVAAIECAMADDPTIMVATGRVIADGIGGPGLRVAEAEQAIRADRADQDVIAPVFSGYGCNMAVRLAPMRAHAIAFDERLPLYGWQEDVDLSRRLAAFGSVVKVEAAVGVHLGVKIGRNSGLRLGYSQVANPLYLAGKGAGYPLGRAIQHIGRNLAMNIARAARPEPYVDRRGRLRGNLLAFSDLIRRRMAPERVLEL
ncbi:glycosyltransferase family 2 protein [Acidisoma cellulosilytica]|uniref:Glycosyltransferase family 2 protein n=1 Tax=Acidisoma cellulosilyticum TaxID=2802395 RepID=A0A963Z2P5_9PROT|nr:glycosyltransferase family 2 protein [Acidisoma cellulosilyticum]MCB8881752.1 glycosyltransferase family 2 protein [Acidisoma cellulosilyticum]